MKKKIALCLAVVMAATLVFAGCGKKDTKDAEKNDVTSSKWDDRKLVVGFDASFPPYGYKDGDDYVGFDLDLAQEVCDRNGWELVKQPIDWDVKDAELKGGTIDCIWNGFTINGREDDYTWSEPYVDNSQVFVVAKDSGIESFDDLAGKVVLVQADSSALHTLEDEENTDAYALRKTFADLQQVPEYETALMNLEAGAADAVAMDIGVAKTKLASNDKLVIMEKILSTEQYGVGFKKGNTELRDAVQKTLDEMVKDGTFMKIAEKWDLADSVCLGK